MLQYVPFDNTTPFHVIVTWGRNVYCLGKNKSESYNKAEATVVAPILNG